MNNIGELLDIHRNILTKTTFDINSKTENKSIELYLKIYENTYACQQLIECQLKSSITMILRGIIEAHIDLHNLCNDNEYINILELQWVKSELDFYRGVLETRPSEKVLNDVSKNMSDSELSSMIEYLENRKTEVSQLIKIHYKVRKAKDHLSISSKFKKADESKVVYRTVYNRLCIDTHNTNSNAFSGGNKKLEGFKSIQHSELKIYHQVIARALNDSAKCVKKILGLNNIDELLEQSELFLYKLKASI